MIGTCDDRDWPSRVRVCPAGPSVLALRDFDAASIALSGEEDIARVVLADVLDRGIDEIVQVIEAQFIVIPIARAPAERFLMPEHKHRLIGIDARHGKPAIAMPLNHPQLGPPVRTVACPGAGDLAKRLKHDTGSHFLDWIDFIQAPRSGDIRKRLTDVGFTRRPVPGEPDSLIHEGAMFRPSSLIPLPKPASASRSIPSSISSQPGTAKEVVDDLANEAGGFGLGLPVEPLGVFENRGHCVRGAYERP